MKIHDVEQGTLDWVRLHFGIPTASGADNLVTPELKMRDSAMFHTYVYRKASEKHRGVPQLGVSTFAMDQGVMMEEEAKPFFELDSGMRLRNVGFITSDDGLSGCSPDALVIDEDMGFESKCPNPDTHTKYLYEGGVPKEYRAQVHFSMFVTGLPRWGFLSYRRKFPPLWVITKRDEKVMDVFRKAVDAFHRKLPLVMERIGNSKVEWKEVA
jgi:hypothetical protein